MTSRFISINRRRKIFLAFLIAFISIILYASGVLAKAVIDRSDYGDIIDRTESDLLQRTEVTRYYHDMSWRHNDELIDIVTHMTPVESMKAISTGDLWMPNMRALLNGKGDTVIITAEQVNALSEMLLLVADRGSPSLHDDIIQEMDRLHLSDFIGMTMQQAWVHLHEVWGVYDPPPASDYNDANPYQTPTARHIYTSRREIIYTPQETPIGGEYASFWNSYRNLDDEFGFAYPADWILRTIITDAGEIYFIGVCNSDVENFSMDRPKGTCIWFVKDGGVDPLLPLDQAAIESRCNENMTCECSSALLIPETAGHPARAELQFTAMYYDPPWTAFAVVFRNSAGKLIEMYSLVPLMQTPEAQAMVTSFVLGNDTPIIAPNFEPSKKIPLDKSW